MHKILSFLYVFLLFAKQGSAQYDINPINCHGYSGQLYCNYIKNLSRCTQAYGDCNHARENEAEAMRYCRPTYFRVASFVDFYFRPYFYELDKSDPLFP